MTRGGIRAQTVLFGIVLLAAIRFAFWLLLYVAELVSPGVAQRDLSALEGLAALAAVTIVLLIGVRLGSFVWRLIAKIIP